MQNISNKVADTKLIAQKIALSSNASDVYLLKGDLGAGKTTFAQGFIKALTSESQNVTSPTFNIIQLYDSRKGTIYHCDFYRLKTPEEFYELGIEDSIGHNIIIAEWPEMAGNVFPADSKIINITLNPDESRTIETNFKF